MDWNPSFGWWIVAGLLVIGELATGTFFLLMLAIGGLAGALTSYIDARLSVQSMMAALVGGGAVLAWYFKRKRGLTPPPAAANSDVNLDIGERVVVAAWTPEGTARIAYRGAMWNARFIGEGTPFPGAHVIEEVRHNELALRSGSQYLRKP